MNSNCNSDTTEDVRKTLLCVNVHISLSVERIFPMNHVKMHDMDTAATFNDVSVILKFCKQTTCNWRSCWCPLSSRPWVCENVLWGPKIWWSGGISHAGPRTRWSWSHPCVLQHVQSSNHCCAASQPGGINLCTGLRSYWILQWTGMSCGKWQTWSSGAHFANMDCV